MHLLRGLQKGVDKFFDGLKKGTVDRFTKKAMEQELPPEAKKTLKQLEKNYDDFLDSLNI